MDSIEAAKLSSAAEAGCKRPASDGNSPSESNKRLKVSAGPNAQVSSTVGEDSSMQVKSGTDKPKSTPRQFKPMKGNYRNYYRFRLGGAEDDIRLPVINSTLSARGGRLKVLDIGCNDGTFTRAVAKNKNVTEIVGVDIDKTLVFKARSAVREDVRKFLSDHPDVAPVSADVFRKTEEDVRTALAELKKAPVRKRGLGRDKKEDEIRKALAKKLEDSQAAAAKVSHAIRSPFNVSFRCEDFASVEPSVATAREREKYDVVLCLSVTKWVHLAGGDKKLMRLFRRISDSLKPGGILILEPQPIKSYKRAIRNGLAKKDVKKVRKLQPANFPQFLVRHYDFKKCRTLREVQKGEGTFKRPIFLLRKRQRESGLKTDEEDESEEPNPTNSADATAPEAPEAPSAMND